MLRMFDLLNTQETITRLEKLMRELVVHFSGIKEKEIEIEDLKNCYNANYEVFWLLDRQKPSIEDDYDFDEERLGVTECGKVIVGFDSGCSCPWPWHDNYPGCYEVMGMDTFFANLLQFDFDEKQGEEWWYESYTNGMQILNSIINKK